MNSSMVCGASSSSRSSASRSFRETLLISASSGAIFSQPMTIGSRRRLFADRISVPNGDMLVTERPGTLRVVRDGVLLIQTQVGFEIRWLGFLWHAFLFLPSVLVVLASRLRLTGPDEDAADLQRLQPRRESKRRRFATARRAQQRGQLATRELQREVPQRLDLAVVFRNVAGRDRAFGDGV